MLKRLILSSLLAAASLAPAIAQETISQRSPDRWFDEGRRLFGEHQYGAARKHFERYLSLTIPSLKAGEAAYYQAYSAMALYHPDAEPLYMRFVAQYPEHPKAPLAFFDLGKFAYQNKEYDKAIAHLNRTDQSRLTADQRVEAQFMTAYSYLTKKDFTKAAEYFNALKEGNHRYTGAANYYAAYLNVREGRFADAQTSIDVAEKDPAYKPMVPQLRTIVLYKRREYDQAIAVGEAALKDSGTVVGTDEIALLVGESYFVKGNYAKADANFSQWQKQNKSAAPLPLAYRMAYSQLQNNKTDQAVEGFKRVAETPDSSKAISDTLKQLGAYYLGVAHLKKQNKPAALLAFERARKFNTGDKAIQEAAWFNYGKLLYDLGRTEEAIDALKVYTIKFPKAPNEAEANDLLGEAFLTTSDYDEALNHISNLPKRSGRIDAAYQRAAFMKGMQLYNEANYELAAKWFDSSLEYTRDTGVTTAAYYFAGETYAQLKNYPSAIKNYQSALKQKSAKGMGYDLRARYGLAYAYMNNKEYAQALPHFRDYVQATENAATKANYNDALVRLADCYYVTKAYNQAVTTYDRAIDAKVPDADYAMYQKGVTQYLAGQTDKAEQTFRTVGTSFSASPYKQQADVQLANLLIEKSRYQEATELLTTIINSGSNDGRLLATALNRRATSYYNLKQYERAVEDYKRVIDSYPNSRSAESALSGLQEALTSAGRIEEFSDYLGRFKEANPENTSLESIEFETAKALYFGQKYEKAAQNLEAYLNKYPSAAVAPEARFYLAESYYRLNRRGEALANHQLVIEEGKSSYVNRALSRSAELQMEAGNYSRAKSLYGQLSAGARNRKEQVQALTGLMEATYATQAYDSTAALAAQILNTPNATVESQTKASLYKGKIDYSRGNFEAATDELLQVVNDAKDINAAEAQYLLAEIQHKQGKFKESIETCFDLNKNFAMYSRWYDRSFLLIAENYIKLDELAPAQYALERLVEKSPNKDTREIARKKLDELKGRKSAQ